MTSLNHIKRQCLEVSPYISSGPNFTSHESFCLHLYLVNTGRCLYTNPRVGKSDCLQNCRFTKNFLIHNNEESSSITFNKITKAFANRMFLLIKSFFVFVFFIFVLRNKACLCGGPVNCFSNFVILPSNVAALIFTSRESNQQNISTWGMPLLHKKITLSKNDNRTSLGEYQVSQN